MGEIQNGSALLVPLLQNGDHKPWLAGMFMHILGLHELKTSRDVARLPIRIPAAAELHSTPRLTTQKSQAAWPGILVPPAPLCALGQVTEQPASFFLCKE